MNTNGTALRAFIGIAIVAAAVAVYALRPAAEGTGAHAEDATAAALPRLLDLGADKCVPCKMMAPILDELKTEYASTFEVQFIDVWKEPAAAEPYGIRLIPTQIFFSADGSELFRHEGYFSREEILGKWIELGLDLPEPGV